MRENVIEDYLVKQVRSIGGLAYKFTSPGRRGVPDRICVFHQNIVVFVECKSPTGRTSALQDFEIKEIRKRGVQAIIIDSRPRVDALINWVKKVMYVKKEMRKVL